MKKANIIEHILTWSYIDAWNNLDSTEDWDNEEYTGSLADTKVFTPSTSILEPPPALDEPKPQEIPSTQSSQNVNLSLLQQEVKFYEIYNITCMHICIRIHILYTFFHILYRNCQNCRIYRQCSSRP